MNIETYFEEQKGITVDAARNAGARYTAIDLCRFAKNYHESKVKNLDIQRVSQQSELLKFLNWLDTQYHNKHYPNINEGIVDNYIKNFNCG